MSMHQSIHIFVFFTLIVCCFQPGSAHIPDTAISNEMQPGSPHSIYQDKDAISLDEVILAHGSLGSKSPWYQPGGDFHTALATEAKKGGRTVHSFTWSGSISPQGIIDGAHQLAKKIISFEEGKRIGLVGHSNAGKVIAYALTLLLAARKALASPTPSHPPELYEPFEEFTTKKTMAPAAEKTGIVNAINAAHNDLCYRLGRRPKRGAVPVPPPTPLKIKSIFLLGTPHNLALFPISMEMVEEVFNLYSVADRIQAFAGSPTIPDDHPGIANLHIELSHDGIQYPPCHQRIHHPLVGKWLLYLPALLHDNQQVKERARILSGNVILDESQARYTPTPTSPVIR